jgi:hypothetical protein
LDRVQESATAGLEAASPADSLPGDVDWHYIMLDIGAEDAHPADRHAAARAFPRDRSAADKHFKRYGRRRGGQLPWVIRDRYLALVDAFGTGEGDAVIHEAGVLLHFATDAALPFNVTADRDGAATGHVRWSAASATQASRPYRTVRHRYHVGLLRRLRSRLDYEVRVSPQRYHPAEDPVDAAFNVLIDTHRDMGVLLGIDRAIMAGLGIQDVDAFTAHLNAYLEEAADRAAPIMESRLEAAALLGANLIGAAWAEAAKPSPAGLTTAPKVVADATAPPVAGEIPFVGSRHSTVYHRATCSHVKRIKPDNLLRFESIEAAEAEGRTPCRLCRPDSP